MSEETGVGPPGSGGGQGQNLEGKCILDWTKDNVKTWLSAKNCTPGFVNALDDTDGSVLATLTLDMMDDINATPRLKKGLMKKVGILLRSQKREQHLTDGQFNDVMEERGTPVQSDGLVAGIRNVSLNDGNYQTAQFQLEKDVAITVLHHDHCNDSTKEPVQLTLKKKDVASHTDVKRAIKSAVVDDFWLDDEKVERVWQATQANGKLKRHIDLANISRDQFKEAVRSSVQDKIPFLWYHQAGSPPVSGRNSPDKVELVSRALDYFNGLKKKEAKNVEYLKLKDLQIPLQDDRISSQIASHLESLIQCAGENPSTKSKLSCFMISGPPGIGKTTEANNIIETIRSANADLLSHWRWHVTVNTCAADLNENYFGILDSYCAAKYSNWDRSNIRPEDKTALTLNYLSQVLEGCEVADMGDEAKRTGSGIVFVVLDEAQDVDEKKLREIVTGLRGAEPSSQCVYVPIIVGTNIRKLRQACVSASGGRAPAEVILGPLSFNGVSNATKFICGLQEPPAEVLTNLTCFAGGNPRLLVLVLGICAYSYGDKELESQDFFELRYLSTSVKKFAEACNVSTPAPQTMDCIRSALKCAKSMVSAVFRFQSFDKILSNVSSEYESRLKSLVAISLTQLPIPQAMLNTDKEAHSLNKLVEAGFFSLKKLAEEKFALSIPNLVLRHAIDCLKSRLQNVPKDLEQSSPFKFRSADENEIDDAGFIIWRLTALRFINQTPNATVPLSEVFPYGLPASARDTRIFLPTKDEMEAMYRAAQGTTARKRWTAKDWENCDRRDSFVYINYPQSSYADSFFQFRVDQLNFKAPTGVPTDFLVVGIQSKRLYSKSAQVDVQAEHKKFKNTGQYRICFR